LLKIDINDTSKRYLDMTTLTVIQYPLDIFYTSSPTNYELSDATIEIINKLASKVGAPSYRKTPQFHKKERPRRRHAKSVISAADWEEMRNFKTTQLTKNVDGINKDIDELRGLLNKLTQSNYNDILQKIIKLLENILKNNATEDELMKVGKSIFEIGSMNKFWSKIYAKLYKDLIHTFPIMKQISEKSFESFLSVFEIIRYVDAEKDYDEFCRVNKENANRRALSSFFVQLMKNHIIPLEKLLTIVKTLQAKFMHLIEQPDNKNEIEEIAENIIIIIQGGGNPFYKNPPIAEFIKNVIVMKVTNHISLTRKTIFKFLDLIDEM